MTTINLQQTLNTVLGLLDEFTADSGFLSKITTAFGEEKAANISPNGLVSALNTLPAIDIRSSDELNGALGAFSAETGKIYLSEGILNNQNLVFSVLLEEIGHYLDNHFGGEDSPGDEGELFSNVVRGVNLSESELTRIQTENDHAVINLDGQLIQIEQAAPIILTVNTTADQNDGSAINGLSLRDAILIANANPNTDYEIHLTGGLTYTVTQNGYDNTALKGDLDIASRSNILYIVADGGAKATIDASGLLNSDRVFHVLNGGSLSLQNVVVTGGITTLFSETGGGIRVNPTGFLDLYNATVTNNTSNYAGGGIENFGTTYLRHGSTVNNNTVNPAGSSSSGGGINNRIGATLIIIDSTISNNNASGFGGGIGNDDGGTLTLINSTVSNNRASSSGGGGGGINNQGSMALVNTTVSGNTGAAFGGGIRSTGSGVANILNSTITNNTAGILGGGGIYIAGTVNLRNTIVAGNFGSYDNKGAGKDIYGTVNGNNYNLIGDLAGAQGTVGTGTDIVNSNPGLGLLQNNGGLTQTHALLAGSSAINAGNNSLIPTDSEDIDIDGDTTEKIPYDQRGLSRISGTKVDIGAFEVQTQNQSLPTPDFNSDGNTDLLWRNPTTGQVGYWYMNNRSVLGAAIAGSAPLEWKVDNSVLGAAIAGSAPLEQKVVGTGDFNKDGKDDLLWQNTATGQVGYWYMNNSTFLAGVIAGSAPLEWKVVDTGDFNKDGKDDLLWQNTTTGQVGYWYMDNSSVLGTAIAGSAPLDWKVAGTGDFNKDGKDDLLWQNTATGQVGYWYMDNSSLLGTAIAGSAPLEWKVAGTGDFNKDGKDDLLWQNTTTGQVGYWYMDNTNILGNAIVGSASGWNLI